MNKNDIFARQFDPKDMATDASRTRRFWSAKRKNRKTQFRMEVKQLQSQVISFLRFPLAVAVIMIHTSVSDITIGGERLAELMPLPVYDFTYGFLDTVFMQVAVPLFFFISGFLFFFKETGFGLKEYGQKLKKRARTLLVPYIFWNLAMLAIMYLGQVLFPGLLSGNNMMIGEYGVKDYLMSFWDVSYRTGGTVHLPMNGSLWFIRDLMVVMVLSPLIWLIIKYLKVWGPIILMLVWLSGWGGPFTGLSTTAIFFFTAGAWFGIKKIKFIKEMTPVCLISCGGVYILSAAIINIISTTPWTEYADKLLCLAGCALIVQTSGYYINNGKWHPKPFLAKSSFFLFAYHSPVVGFIKKALWKVCEPDCDMAVFGVYFLSVALTVLIGLCLYWGLNKVLPRFTAVITGGR